MMKSIKYCMYTFDVRDIGFAKKLNGREFYGGQDAE